MTPPTDKKKRASSAKGLPGRTKSSPAAVKKAASKRTNNEQGDKIPLRPYARLLTMLGDQLIRNERVALVELIKNAYDADASWVKVTFENFDEDFASTAASKIIIEDDGVGMSESIIRDHWANPATPVKLLSKAAVGRSPGGRIVQGEKGIGRFALLKLGRNIQITTRTDKADEERVVTLDLSGYDTDFLQGGKPLFLDNLRVGLKRVKPAELIVRDSIKLGARRKTRKPYGTRIEISHLTSTWSRRKVEGVYEDMARLQSIFALGPEDKKRRDADPFEVLIHRNDRHETFEAERRETLESLLENNTVFRIEGKFDNKQQAFDFKIGRRNRHIKLDDPEFAGLAVFKEAFGKKGEELRRRGVECGPFGFAFFVFDFSPDAQGARLLSKPDRELIRDHRIYLYRDGIRVYPYGDKDDDWLQIDTRRGTVRAAEFLSNDQVTGYVTITQQENPELRDKTSREGLVDTGHPTEDFISLLQIFLAWVRAKPYHQYRQDLKVKGDVQVFKSQRVQGALDDLLSKADQLPAPMQETLQTAERDYRAERRYLVQRAEATENLAGVGLSVESASHDLQLAMHSALRTIDTLLSEAHRGDTLDPEHVLRELQAIRGALSFVDTQLRDLQQLFKTTKQRRKDIRVIEVLEKVARLFKGMTDRAKITVTMQTVGTGPLVAKTTDAVLLQLFLNLFDNAVYWLDTQPANKVRKIEIVLDSERQQLVFADNGPGIADDDLPYIFEPFYSGKGQEGRGLGLYIARQLLDRHDYRIDVAPKRDRALSGANFLISFVEEAQ
ncbi:signal transduction histidine kinase [Lysobacter enzymogenes]|uniref:sensor histidine kinase n=1 Tax=Lysobacter enzymogenes TaxID=69 RepID=UPI00339143B3